MCGIVQRRAEYLPLFTEAELKRRMHFLLMRTPWAGVAWHCWRRLSAAAMVALGAPITAVCIWNRWTSLRKAWEYAVLGPDWEFELPDQAPRAHLVASTTTLPLSSVQLLLASAFGRRTAPNASGSPIIIMVDNNDEGDVSDDGVLGASGTNRGVSQENGNDVRALWAASKTQHRPCVRVRVWLRRPKVRRTCNSALSTDRSQQEMERPESASPQPTPSPSPD